MGSRAAPYVCHHTTSAITHIHRSLGYFSTNYKDDFPGAEPPGIVWQSYEVLSRIFRDLGIKESIGKAVPPTPVMSFLGTGIDAVNQTIFMVPELVIKLNQECTRRDLESLVGKLSFCTNCVHPACLFLLRLLRYLSGMTRGKWYVITEEARKDIKWWWNYFPRFKTHSIIWLEQMMCPDQIMATDACMTGCNGNTQSHYFRIEFPEIWFITDKINIAHLKMIALIIGLKIWVKQVTGKGLHMLCNNSSVATVINSGRSYDTFLQQVPQELCCLCACNSIEIRISHIKGVDNRIPDLLSRYGTGPQYRKQFETLIQKLKLQRTEVPLKMLRFTYNW